MDHSQATLVSWALVLVSLVLLDVGTLSYIKAHASIVQSDGPHVPHVRRLGEPPCIYGEGMYEGPIDPLLLIFRAGPQWFPGELKCVQQPWFDSSPSQLSFQPSSGCRHIPYGYGMDIGYGGCEISTVRRGHVANPNSIAITQRNGVG